MSAKRPWGSLRQACEDASKVPRALYICSRRHFRCASSAAKVIAICDEFESHMPTNEGCFEHHLEIDGGGRRQQYLYQRGHMLSPYKNVTTTRRTTSTTSTATLLPPPLKSLEIDATPAVIGYQGSGSMMSMHPAQISDYSVLE